MAFLPLVTWVTMDASEKPPERYEVKASLRRVFSFWMTLLPPAWQAAQLPAKTLAPISSKYYNKDERKDV